MLRRLSGTHADLLADEGIVRMILPAVRGDYQAVETYAPRPGARLRCAVTALVGDSDPQAAVAEAEAWADHSTGPFDHQAVPGGRFSLVAAQQGVIAAIRDRLGVGARSS